MRLLKHLDTRRADENVPGVTVGLMVNEAGKSATYRTQDEGFDPDAVRYPVLEDGLDWDDYATVTVAELRESFAALATAAGVDAGELIGAVMYHYECEGRGAKMRLEEVERELARMGARRMLLAAEDLDKVQRYEGHLHRQLIQTLRELEAMGERRRGNAAPLARLDTSGLDATG